MSQTFDPAAEKAAKAKPSDSSPVLSPDVLTPDLAPDELGRDDILTIHLPGQVEEESAPAPKRPPLTRQNAISNIDPVRPPLERREGFRGEQPGMREARLGALNIPEAKGGQGPIVLPSRKMGKGENETTVVGEGDKGSAIAGTPRSVAEVAMMEDDDIAAFPGAVGSGWPPGPQARPIVMDAFGQNWFYAKDVLLSKKWPDSISAEAPMRKTPALATKLMWKLLAFRTYEYDGILHMLRERYKARSPEIAKDDDVLKWGSAGSVTLTSDVDVNLAGKYNMEAVADFNAEFRKRGWSVEAGTGLDVNVYCKDNMHGFGIRDLTDTEVGIGPDDTTAVMTINTEKNMPANVASEERDQSHQEVAAMIKLIRFMTHTGDWRGNADWEKYKKGIRASDATPPKDRDMATMAKVMTAEIRYDAWRAELEAMKRKLVEEGTAVTNLLEGVAGDSANKTSDALDMQANNRLYEQRIETLKVLRAKLEALVADKSKDNTTTIREVAIQLRQVILEAGMFANEAMITAGASNFVVFGTQVGVKKETLDEATGKLGGQVTDLNVQLTEKQFYDAFTEQFADTVKEFHHFKRLDEGLYKGGKYLMRMTLAADQLDGVPQANVPNYEKLRQLGDFAMTAKNMNGEPDAINRVMWAAIAERFPGLKNVNDVHGFTEIVTNFGVAVAGAYKAAKAGVKVPPPPKETDPDYADKKKAYDEAVAQKKGTKLKLAALHGEDLSATITRMSNGAVTPKT